MKSSHLQARLDLYARLRGRAVAGEILGLSFAPLSASWRRNAPGVADELEVSILAAHVPWDLRILEGAAVDFWLFEHRDPSRCNKGDPGHFSGIVDEVSRDTIGDGRVVLTCRDHTALALATRLPEDIVKGFRLYGGPSLTGVVLQLLALMPGGETWDVESVGRAGETPIQTSPPQIVPARRGAKTPPKVQVPPEAPNLGHWVRPGEVTVWDAICDVCVRHGVVPEVREGATGRRVVSLVNTQDLQTSTAYRPFARDGQTVRLFREGVDVTVLRESLTLTRSDKLPDFVEVASINPVTGRRVAARWPPEPADAEARKKRTNGIFQTIDGVSSQAEILRRARDAWQGLAHNQYRVELAVPHPWSAGGGPDSPDLLDLAYGAGVALERRPVDVAREMERQGVPVLERGRLAGTSRRLGSLGMLFQATEVTHTWGAAEYACAIGLRQFLGLEEFDVLDDRAPTRRLTA